MTHRSLKTQDLHLVIHGGGYVGLTAAIHYALAGVTVTVYDPDHDTVKNILAGNPRAGDFLNYLKTDVSSLVAQGLLNATSDFESVCTRSIHSLAVPTEKDGMPYDKIVKDTLNRLALTTPQDSLIIIESTLTPGFLDSAIKDIKENLGAKVLGQNYFMAVCPRRDWFADPQKNLGTLTRVVGGITPTCTKKACDVLSIVSNSIHKTDYQTAEICKALENALLHIPVMFAHELAYSMPQKNIAEALRLATTHWRLMPLHLGFGTGGRCVPLGTKYLVDGASSELSLGKSALDFDNNIRQKIAASVSQRIGVGKKALVLGIGYRPEFKDAGLSPGLAVAHHLKAFGVDCAVYDPLWDNSSLSKLTALPVREPSQNEDAILLATPHKSFAHYPKDKTLWKPGQLVLDAQGKWNEYRSDFSGYGVSYFQVGDPGWV